MRRGISYLLAVAIAFILTVSTASANPFERVDAATFQYWFEYTFEDLYPNANNPYVDDDPSYPGQSYYIIDNITVYVEGRVRGNGSDLYILNYWFEDGTLIWTETFNTSSFNYTFMVGSFDTGPGMYKLEIIHRMEYIHIIQVGNETNETIRIVEDRAEAWFEVVEYMVELYDVYLLPFYQIAYYDKARYNHTRYIDLYLLSITPIYNENLSENGYRLLFRNITASFIIQYEEIVNVSNIEMLLNGSAVNTTAVPVNTTLYVNTAVGKAFLNKSIAIQANVDPDAFIYAPINMELRNYSVGKGYPPPSIQEAFNLTEFPGLYPSRRTYVDSQYLCIRSNATTTVVNASGFERGRPLYVNMPYIPVARRGSIFFSFYRGCHYPEMPIPGETLLMWIYVNMSDVIANWVNENTTIMHLKVSMEVYNGTGWTEVTRIYPLLEHPLYVYIDLVETRWNGSDYDIRPLSRDDSLIQLIS